MGPFEKSVAGFTEEPYDALVGETATGRGIAAETSMLMDDWVGAILALK